MFKFWKSYKRNDHAASATEFALLAPMLVFLLIGTIDFGLFIKQEMQLQEMVSEAASYAVRTHGNADVLNVAEGAYKGDFRNVHVNTSIECECVDGVLQVCPADCAEDDFERRYVSISATGVYSPLFPYPGIPDSMTMESTARMRID